jgi:DNA mismatch repair protein PMS2
LTNSHRNALDAGATSIDILLQNHGLSQIQVIDNGTGIPAADREFICKRHYTSKTDGDLTNGVSTFGFRGEALSSICELSEYVEILTKCKEDDVGLKMKFDSKGNMINKTPEQCRVGTTVTVVNIFSKVPVRRQVC